VLPRVFSVLIRTVGCDIYMCIYPKAEGQLFTARLVMRWLDRYLTMDRKGRIGNGKEKLRKKG